MQSPKKNKSWSILDKKDCEITIESSEEIINEMFKLDLVDKILIQDNRSPELVGTINLDKNGNIKIINMKGANRRQNCLNIGEALKNKIVEYANEIKDFYFGKFALTKNSSLYAKEKKISCNIYIGLKGKGKKTTPDVIEEIDVIIQEIRDIFNKMKQTQDTKDALESI